MENIAAWQLILGGLAVLCGGTRLAGWIRAAITLLRIWSEEMERSDNSIPYVDPAATAKALSKERVGLGNGSVQALAEIFAAKAEATVGTPDGGATKARKQSKGKKFAQGIARWAPIIGAFL